MRVRCMFVVVVVGMTLFSCFIFFLFWDDCEGGWKRGEGRKGSGLLLIGLFQLREMGESVCVAWVDVIEWLCVTCVT